MILKFHSCASIAAEGGIPAGPINDRFAMYTAAGRPRKCCSSSCVWASIILLRNSSPLRNSSRKPFQCVATQKPCIYCPVLFADSLHPHPEPSREDQTGQVVHAV